MSKKDIRNLGDYPQFGQGGEMEFFRYRCWLMYCESWTLPHCKTEKSLWH